MTVGFDNLAFNHGLLLDLPFEEGSGVLTLDRAKPHHELTLHGPPTWTQLANGLMVLDFDNDWLDCPAVDTADLNFTTSDFTVLVWVNADSLATSPIIVCRGLLITDGWYFAVSPTGVSQLLLFRVGQNRVVQSPAASVVINNWHLLGAVRDGTDGRVYNNGIDVTDSSDSLFDPLTATRELHIGTRDDESANRFDGKMYRPRIWGRALSAEDWMNIFELERGFFGV